MDFLRKFKLLERCLYAYFLNQVCIRLKGHAANGFNFKLESLLDFRSVPTYWPILKAHTI